MRHWPPSAAALPGPPMGRASRAPAMSRARIARLVPMTETERSDVSPAGRLEIIRRLERALRAERRRGMAGHWTYDLNRHLALKQAVAAERARVSKP